MTNDVLFTAVAFYGLTDSAAARKSWYEQILSVIDALDCCVHTAGVRAPGFGEKLGAFERFHPRLEKSDFKELAGVTLLATKRGVAVSVASYSAAALLSLRADVCLVTAHPDVVQFGSNQLLDIANLCIETMTPIYGIGYCRHFSRGPVAYAMGTGQGLKVTGPDYQESKRISSWSSAMSKTLHKTGTLRDVYPWNFLSEIHLSRLVEGRRLDDRIRSGTGRGTLTPVAGNMLLWSLDETDIAAVRPVLKDAGFFFDWEQYLRDTGQDRPQRVTPRPPAPRPSSAAPAMDMARRRALIEKIIAQYEEADDPDILPVVSLEDFFEGNTDRGSIGANLSPTSHPGLAAFCMILKAIRSRRDVQDVLIAIHETLEADDERDRDIWPDSDWVYILTSASAEDVATWTEALCPTEVGEGWVSGKKPPRAPEPKKGNSCHVGLGLRLLARPPCPARRPNLRLSPASGEDLISPMRSGLLRRHAT